MRLQVIGPRKKWTINLTGIRHSFYNLGFALIKLAICCLRLEHAIEYLAETNGIASIQWSYSTHTPPPPPPHPRRPIKEKTQWSLTGKKERTETCTVCFLLKKKKKARWWKEELHNLATKYKLKLNYNISFFFIKIMQISLQNQIK